MTQRTGPWIWVLGTLLVTGGLTGCVVRSQPVAYPSGGGEYPSGEYADVYVAQPPPQPVVEYPPPPPGHGFVWLQGYWDWSGYDWYWVNGYWLNPRPGYFYVAPRYVQHGGRWAYQRSHWVDRQGRRDYVYARPAPARRGSWRGAPGADAPRYQSGGAVARPAPAYPGSAPAAPSQGGGSWRAAPAPAAPPSSNGGYGRGAPGPAGPSQGGGSWRAAPAPAAPPPPASAPAGGPGSSWRASPAPAAAPAPTVPPPSVESNPTWRSQSRTLPGTWTPTPAPGPSPGAGSGGPRRVRPVATEPTPSTTPARVEPGPRRASPQAQPAQSGQQSTPQPVQEQPRARRSRPAAAQQMP